MPFVAGAWMSGRVAFVIPRALSYKLCYGSVEKVFQEGDFEALGNKIGGQLGRIKILCYGINLFAPYHNAVQNPSAQQDYQPHTP